MQASGAEEIKQLYLEAEQLLVWVRYKYKLKLDNFFTQVTGERGSLGRLGGVPNTVEDAARYQVGGFLFSEEGSWSVGGEVECWRYKQL